MKRTISIILTLVVILGIPMMFTGCGTSDVENQEIPQTVLEENSLFVDIGDTVTVDGKTWTASIMTLNYENNFYTEDFGCTFWVNRVTMEIILVNDNGSSKYGGAYSIPTGMYYEGTITIEGIPVPNN